MGIREGLLLRQYMDERTGKAEEMKARAKLYNAQAEGIKAEAQQKLLDYEQAVKLQQAMQGQFPELGGGAQGLTPAPGPASAPPAPGPPLPPEMGVTPEPGQALRETLTQVPPERAPLDLGGGPSGRKLPQAPPPTPPEAMPAAPAVPGGAAPAAARPPAAKSLAPAPATGLPSSYTSLDPTSKQRLDAAVQSAARQTGLDPSEIYGLMGAESNFDLGALSPKGAIGPMQLMPDTAKQLGVDPYSIEGNVLGGAQYYAQLKRRYGGDVARARAAYNAGPGAVDRYGGVPPYQETRAHGARTDRYVQRFRGQRAQESRVAGPGAPAPAAGVTGGLETPAATPPRPQTPPDPAMARIGRMRQLAGLMAYYGKYKEATNYLNTSVAMEAAYRAQEKQQHLDRAAYYGFILQANPHLAPAQKQQYMAAMAQALIQADQTTNARQYTEAVNVPLGAQVRDPVTGQILHTNPQRPMVQGPESQVIQPPTTPGQPATVIAPAPGKPAKDFSAMTDEALLESVRTGGPQAEAAQKALDMRKAYRSQTTGARAGESTTETAEARRGLPISQGDPQLAKRTYDRSTGRLVAKEVPTGEVYDQTGGEGRYIDLANEADQKQMSAMHQLLPVVNKLSERYQKLYGPGGLFEDWQKQSRLKRGAIGAWAEFAEKDTNFVALKRETQALASRLGKAYGGETGNLSNQDIQRISQIFGQLGIMPDNPKVAFALLNDFYDTTEGIAGAILANPVFTWDHSLVRRPPDLEAGQSAPGAARQKGLKDMTTEELFKELGKP